MQSRVNIVFVFIAAAAVLHAVDAQLQYCPQDQAPTLPVLQWGSSVLRTQCTDTRGDEALLSGYWWCVPVQISVSTNYPSFGIISLQQTYVCQASANTYVRVVGDTFGYQTPQNTSTFQTFPFLPLNDWIVNVTSINDQGNPPNSPTGPQVSTLQFGTYQRGNSRQYGNPLLNFQDLSTQSAPNQYYALSFLDPCVSLDVLKWLWSVYVRHQHEVLDKDNN